jgi:hypothetical protein
MLTYRIDPRAGLLFVTGRGLITQAERIAAMRAWMSDPAFRPGLNTLCDFSAASSVPSRSELHDIITFIEQHAESIGRKKLAMIVARPVTYGVARQFQALTAPGPLDVNVFTDHVTAFDWLRDGGQ